MVKGSKISLFLSLFLCPSILSLFLFHFPSPFSLSLPPPSLSRLPPPLPPGIFLHILDSDSGGILNMTACARQRLEKQEEDRKAMKSTAINIAPSDLIGEHYGITSTDCHY